MRYKITLFFILLFLFVPIITPSTFNYGLNQSLDFISIAINYFLDKPYIMSDTIFSTSDSFTLLLGGIYYGFCSISFILLSFYIRFYEGENQNTKIKSFLGFLIISFSILAIFSSLLNITEYKKINTYNDRIETVTAKEVKDSNELIINVDNSFKIKNAEDFYEENTVLTIEMPYNKIRIKKLKKDNSFNYKEIIRDRYKYKLKIKSEKQVTIKQEDVIILEYELSGLYNIDYIIGVNGEIFVINFILEDESLENIRMVNDFFINSFYIQRG